MCSFCQTFLENCTTFWQNELIKIKSPNSPKRLSIGGVSHAPMLTGEKERQQACQSLSTSTRPCAWYSVLGTVRTVHTQLIRTPRLAVSTAAVEAVGSWGKRRAAVRRCDVRCARRAVAVCGGGGAAGAAAMGRLFTLTRHHTYIAQHTLCLSHPQLDCKVGLLCK